MAVRGIFYGSPTIHRKVRDRIMDRPKSEITKIDCHFDSCFYSG